MLLIMSEVILPATLKTRLSCMTHETNERKLCRAGQEKEEWQSVVRINPVSAETARCHGAK